MSGPEEKITSKAELVEKIREGRRRLEETLAGLSEEQLSQLNEPETGQASPRTVKDLVAHVAAWETRLAGWLEMAHGGEVPNSPQTAAEIDQLNAETFMFNMNRPLDQVWDEFMDSFQKALGAVEGTDEADLLDPQRFVWRKGRPLWWLAAANTYWHYDEHREEIESWKKREGTG